jgi:hypothetical protein
VPEQRTGRRVLLLCQGQLQLRSGRVGHEMAGLGASKVTFFPQKRSCLFDKKDDESRDSETQKALFCENFFFYTSIFIPKRTVNILG